MPLLNKTQAAEMLGQSVKTLDNWRYTGKGPAYIKLPKSIMYESSALNAYITAQTVQPLTAVA